MNTKSIIVPLLAGLFLTSCGPKVGECFQYTLYSSKTKQVRHVLDHGVVLGRKRPDLDYQEYVTFEDLERYSQVDCIARLYE